MTGPGGDPIDRAVVAYDRELVPWLFEHWAQPFVDLATPSASASILDLACGTGLIVRHLLDRLGDEGSIRGVDLDPDMLAHAAARVVDSRVSWHEADVASLPFEDASIDLVCCHQGLQFFPDHGTALAEVRRVLRPGGRLAVAVWGRPADNPWPAALAGAVRSLLGEAAGDSMLAVCRLGEPADLHAALTDAGFEPVELDHRRRTASHPDITQAIAGQLSAMPSGSALGDLQADQRSALTAMMGDLLADHTRPTGELTLPSTSLLATATRP